MEPEIAKEQLTELQIVDVRQNAEFADGHIEGSIHIPLKELPGRADELDPARRTLVVCQVGQRSDMAARFLRSMGLDAYNLDGGLKRWTGLGLPILSDEGASGRVVEGWSEILED